MNKKAFLILANVFSILRILCAFLLFIDEATVRVVAVCFAALSDYLDGYFARKMNQITKIGTVLDPLADKLFVVIALLFFFLQGTITLIACFIFLLRELSLLLFYAWLRMTNAFDGWQVRSFFCGKIMTACQFIALFLLCCNLEVPHVLFALMALFGIGSFFELLWLRYSSC